MAALSLLAFSAGCGQPGDLAGNPAQSVPTATGAPVSGTRTTLTPESTTSAVPTIRRVVGFASSIELTARDGNTRVPLKDATALAVDPDGRVAIVDEHGFLALVDPADSEWGSITTTGRLALSGVEFLADGSLVTSDTGGSLRRWGLDSSGQVEAAGGAGVSPFNGEDIAVMAVSPDGEWVAVGSIAGQVSLLRTIDDGATWEDPIRLARFRERIAALAVDRADPFDELPPRVVASTIAGQVALFEGDPLAPRRLGDSTDNPVPALLLADDGESVLRGGAVRPVQIDLATGVDSDVDVPTASGTGLSALASITSRGTDDVLIASGGSDADGQPTTSARPEGIRGVVRLWLAADPTRELAPARGFRGRIIDLAFLPDASGLVVLTEGSGVSLVPLLDG